MTANGAMTAVARYLYCSWAFCMPSDSRRRVFPQSSGYFFLQNYALKMKTNRPGRKGRCEDAALAPMFLFDNKSIRSSIKEDPDDNQTLMETSFSNETSLVKFWWRSGQWVFAWNC